MVMSEFARTIYLDKYSWDGKEEWPQTAERVVKNVMGSLAYREGDYEYDTLLDLIKCRMFIPGGRYLYASGRPQHQVQNCILLRCDDTREGWAELSYKCEMSLMTGAGVGVDYSDLRSAGTAIVRTGGVASGPIAKMKMINEIGRGAMQGGSRRAAIWAGLNWKHNDIFEFIILKDWPKWVIEKKAEAARNGGDFPWTMDMTNVSVLLDDEFFEAYHNIEHKLHGHSRMVYSLATEHMLRHAEPGFSVDIGPNAGETLRNACTEITSHDDSDVCNLGSLNIARFSDRYEFREAVDLATLFLLAGTVYSHLPYHAIDDVRRKNRRLGLGLMGVHEWLLSRGHKYAPNYELAGWMEEYSKSTVMAAKWADKHGLSRPVKTRAIAPTGTIGIVGETTTGIEPIFAVAYKRRYLVDGKRWSWQYVIDPTAERLIQNGVDPCSIEDAYKLSHDVESRIRFQAWMQMYVDHGISSTVNLPRPITDEMERDEFGDMLIKYLPMLRGITVYPDGARGGQPLVVVDYDEAKAGIGTVFQESEDRCVGGSCGI